MMHIQEAGNYIGVDGVAPSNGLVPPPPMSANATASPRRNRHIVHDGASEYAAGPVSDLDALGQLGSNGALGSLAPNRVDWRSDSDARDSLAAANAHYAGSIDAAVLDLIQSAEASRKGRRAHLRTLGDFATANVRMRKEARPDLQCFEASLAVGGGAADDSDAARPQAFVQVGSAHQANAPMARLGSMFGRGIDDHCGFYGSSTRLQVDSARGGAPQGLSSIRPNTSSTCVGAPASPDRAASAPTRRGDGISSSAASRPAARRDPSAGGGHPSAHRHHHYKCHLAKAQRLERRWRREAMALYCPHLLGTRPSALISAEGAAERPREVAAAGQYVSSAPNRIASLTAQTMLFEGEGYNSEVPSDVAKHQWRRTRTYYGRFYSSTMRSLAAQRAAQRRRRCLQLRDEARRTRQPSHGREGCGKVVRDFYNQYDSSASCSSFDEFEDVLGVARGMCGHGRGAGPGLPLYRKPLWAMDAAAGILSAQYDLLARAEQRRRTAADVMRVSACPNGAATINVPPEDDASLMGHLDSVFPHTVPLRQYAASKTAAMGGRGASRGARGATPRANSPNQSDATSCAWSPQGSSESDGVQTLTAAVRGAAGTMPSHTALRGRSLPDDAASSESSVSSDSSLAPNNALACDCSACSCSGASSFGGDSDTVSPTSAGHTHGGACAGGTSHASTARLSELPPHIKDAIDLYVSEKRKALEVTRRAVSEGGGNAARLAGDGLALTKGRRGASVWLNWLRWSIFRKGGALSRSFVGILASVKRRQGFRAKRGAGKLGARRVTANGDRRETRVASGSGGVTAAESYFSGFFKRRFIPLNLSSRVPFLDNYQARFFRIASAAELHRGIIHPFAVDPPLLMSCAKDLKGEAKDSPHPPTLVTMAAVDTLIAGAASFAAASASARVGADIGAQQSPSRSQMASKPSGAPSNLINRPVLMGANNGGNMCSRTNPSLQALQQLLQEQKQAHKNALAQAKSLSTEVHLVPEYQYAFLQEKDAMYGDIVRTLTHLKQGGEGGQQQGLGQVAAGGNPLGSMGILSSASYALTSASSASTSHSGALPAGSFFPPALLAEDTERHINGILFRRYGLLLAGSTQHTIDFHRFTTLISPAILRYKLVHTNTSFVKEARTLQETKAAERAKQAEAQQQAQKALQQQQEQQRLLQQQMMAQQGGQPSANQPVYIQFQGGSIGALAVGADNTLLPPTAVPGALPNSQATMLMVSPSSNQPPQPMLCYIIIVSPAGINHTTSGVILHPQQVLQMQQQLQMQHQQQQMMLLQQQQQQGGSLNQQQQQQLFQLQQEQQQLALMMGAVVNQQQMMLNIGTNGQRQATGAAADTKPPALPSLPPVNTSVPWQVPSFLALMEGAKLLPSILYLQSSDVLFGTTRSTRHAVSVPTSVCVVTSNARLGATLARSYVSELRDGIADPSHSPPPNMPRWMRQYTYPLSDRSASADADAARGGAPNTNGHINAEVLGASGCPHVTVSAAEAGGPEEGLVGVVSQLNLRHVLHGHQQGPRHSGAGSLAMPHTVGVNHIGAFSLGGGASSRLSPAEVNPNSVLSPIGRVLEGRIVHPHAYVSAMKMGEMALRHWARRTHQYSLLASPVGPSAGATSPIDIVALSEAYCTQQELILAKQLSRLSRSNSCEVVTLHPSLLRKKMSGEERRRRKALLAREPLKRAGTGTGGIPQPLQQGQQPAGQPIGVGDAPKTKPQSSSSADKPLFSREAISVVVIQQGGSALSSDPLLAAWHQRYAKSLLRTRHSVAGVGGQSPIFEGHATPESSSADVPSVIATSQHLGSGAEAMMVAAARPGGLSSDSGLDRDAMRANGAHNASEFLAHCIADFTIHNEHMYRYAHVKGSGAAAQASGSPQGQGGAPPPHTNPEVEAQRSISKALLTGVRLGYMRAVEIIKLSVEATNDELAFAANRHETLHKGKGGALMPQTVTGQRYGVGAGRTLQRPQGTARAKAFRARSTNDGASPPPSAKSLQLEARVAVMQQQCRYVADRGIYQFASLYRGSFTDYPSLMLSLLLREGVLSATTLSSAITASGGSMPHSGNALSSCNWLPQPSLTFTIPPPLLDSLLPSLYHHPLTSPATVSDSCGLQNTLVADMQLLVGVSLSMPTGSPPPTAAPQQFAPIAMGSPQQGNMSVPRMAQGSQQAHCAPSPQMNDTSLLRAKFSNHALLTRAMTTLLGPSSPTSSSTIYVRDNKLFCATVGHHSATVLFNISPLAQHVVQNALNIRQQFAKTLAAQLQMLQQVHPSQVSAGVVTSAVSGQDGSLENGQQRNQGTVINMQPLQAGLRAFLFRGTTLTNLVLGDDIRYRYQSGRATASAVHNSALNAMLSHSGGSPPHSSNLALSTSGGHGSPSPSNRSAGLATSSPSVSATGFNASVLKGMAPGLPPAAFVDINTYKTQQSVVPAGCCGQLFVPLSALPDLSLNGRQARVRSHNKSRQRRAGSTSSMSSSTGSLVSSLHSSASRQDSLHSDRRGGVIGEGTTIASSASSASSSASVTSRVGERLSGHSVSLQIPNRSALRAANDLVTTSRQAASWLGVQLAASTFTNYQTHDSISPNLKLPLPSTVPVGPTVCMTTVEVSSVFSQAPVPCAPSQPNFLACNPPPSSAMLVGGTLPALRGVPSQGLGASGGDDGQSQTSIGNSPLKSAVAPPTLVSVSGPNTVIHRLPTIPEIVVGNPQANSGNPSLPDPLFANALATVSSVGNLAYTVQTTVHSKSSLSPNYTVLTASTDTWMAIPPEEASMFLSMLCPPDWANHSASTNSFLSVMLAAKVDFGSADVRGPFVYDRRRSYMSHHSSSTAQVHSNAHVPSPWTCCALGASGVLSTPNFLAANGIAMSTSAGGEHGATEFVPPPVPTMVPTLPHPSTVTPSSTHYTSFFLSQTYCDVFGPCDYIRGYLNGSATALRGLLESLSRHFDLSPAQLSSIALQQQREQQMGRAPVPVANPPLVTPSPSPPKQPSAPGAAPQATVPDVAGNTASTTNYNISSPDSCTVIFEVLSLLEAFSDLTLKATSKTTHAHAPTAPLLSPQDRLRIHHLLYSVKIIMAYGDYYHAGGDGEVLGPDGSPKTENSWYWEELAELEARLSRLCSNVAPGVGAYALAGDRPCHVNVEFPIIPPPPPVHVRLYRRFREKQADLMYHQVLRPRIEAHRQAYDDQLRRGNTPPPPLTEKEREKANGPPTAPQTAPPPPRPTTDPTLRTCPTTQGGDDFRNAASILSEVIAEEAAALDRMCLHYRLVKDVLRRRRGTRLRALLAVLPEASDTADLRQALSNHLTACAQPFEGYELLVRGAAPEAAPSDGAQIPITGATCTSGSASSGASNSNAPVSSAGTLAGAAEALSVAHRPAQHTTAAEGEVSNTTITTHATYHSLTYSQPRHYVAQVLAFK